MIKKEWIPFLCNAGGKNHEADRASVIYGFLAAQSRASYHQGGIRHAPLRQIHDLVGKDVLRINPKYYVVDPAMRFFLIGRKGQDTGHVLENIVYLELLRRGFHICVGALPGGEVDFVARDENGQIYIQVAESTQQPEVLERELKSLRAIKDNYPKLLLTLDEVGATADYDGIQKKNVLRWLLGEK